MGAMAYAPMTDDEAPPTGPAPTTNPLFGNMWRPHPVIENLFIQVLQ